MTTHSTMQPLLLSYYFVDLTCTFLILLLFFMIYVSCTSQDDREFRNKESYTSRQHGQKYADNDNDKYDKWDKYERSKSYKSSSSRKYSKSRDVEE